MFDLGDFKEGDWRTLGGTEDAETEAYYATKEECRAAAEKLSAAHDHCWVGIEQFEDGQWGLVDSVGTDVKYADWRAPQDIVLGDYVETDTHGHRGRVHQVHPGYPAGSGCPESDAWLAGQQPEPLTIYKNERWISVLVHGGGSIAVPSALAHRVEPFNFVNDYANQYFRKES